MIKFACLSLVVLLALIAGACASAAETPSNTPIKPGEKIGDFLITTGGEAEAATQHDMECTQQGEGENYRCELQTGTAVVVSNGVYDPQFSGKLEEIWAGHTYEMTINERPVDLAAFGYVDYKHPMVGMMRHWNVVVLTEVPGEITVHSKNTFATGETFENQTVFAFSAP